MSEGGGTAREGSPGSRAGRSSGTHPPQPTAPEVRQLAERLRAAREATGLSFAALAGRTAYSKSSWERYLNGRTLPPRDAVETLAELSGADPARLLALWRLADTAWSGRDARVPASGAVAQAPASAPTDAPAPRVAPAPTTPRTGPEQDAGAPGRPRTPRTAAAPAPGAATGPEPAAEHVAPPAVDRPPSPARERPRTARPLLFVGLAAALSTAVLVGGGTWLWTHLAHEGARPAAAQGQGRLAEPCRGDRCTGLDSEQGETDCWTDAVTRAARDVAGRTVELRVSPACRAAWGRIRQPREGDEVWVETRDRRTQDRQVTVPGHSLYTLMIGVGAPTAARTCYALADGAKGCTAWDG